MSHSLVINPWKEITEPGRMTSPDRLLLVLVRKKPDDYALLSYEQLSQLESDIRYYGPRHQKKKEQRVEVLQKLREAINSPKR